MFAYRFFSKYPPNMLYLPSDLSIKKMYEAWTEQQKENNQVFGSYSMYRSVMKAHKISFTRLGNEECETCILFDFHKKESGHQEANDQDTNVQEIEEKQSSCVECNSWRDHIRRANTARTSYKADVKNKNKNVLVSSVDLQKVSLLF